MEDPKPLLTPLAAAPTRRRRNCVWAVVMALGVVTCMVVLLLPQKKELPLNTATGLLIGGTANLTFWYRNNTHWLPEADLGKMHALVTPFQALLDSNPKNNSLYFASTNTTVQFRTNVVSPQECSTIARATNKSFFSYHYAQQLCYLNDPPPFMALTSGSADSTSKTDCLVSCNRTLSCMGMTYKSQECTHYKATPSNATIMAGWILPSIKPKSTTTNATIVAPVVDFVNKTARVHIYGIAHQDDRELFMATALYATFQDRNAKGVFVYTTAGDFNRQDGWWEAREVGTLAVTDFAVNDAGYYKTTRKDDLISIYNHTVRKVSIGNAVHYFLRISEANMTTMVSSPADARSYFPLGMIKLTEKRYANLTDVQAVVRAILRKETAGIPSVAAFLPEYIDSGNDHTLHIGTGRLMADAIAAEPGLNGCVTTTTFYGYQRSLDAANMKDPTLTFQRRAWLALASALEPVYPEKDVWSHHGMNLGRTFIARVNAATPGVQCKV